LGNIYTHDVQNVDTVKWSRAELRIGVDDGMRNLAPTSYVRPAARNMMAEKKKATVSFSTAFLPYNIKVPKNL